MSKPLQFEIVPHIGIGPVRLGMLPAEVDAVLAPLPGALPTISKSKEVRCYFQASLQIEFSQSGTAQFIGVSNHADLLFLYHGRDVFDLPAPELFALIASHERAQTHTYSPLEYTFPDQVVTLYEADEQYDRKGNRTRAVYAEVGIGSSEYVVAIP
jgi:hypothetical protein